MKVRKYLWCIVSALMMLSTAQAAEVLSTLEDQKSVAVTIYNENLALIKDQRAVTLKNGENSLAFRGVSARMRPETALLRSIGYPGKLSIIEQNFDFDLLTPQKLLEKYVGKQIRVASINPATGKEKVEQAIVLSTNNGVVLKIGDRIETSYPGRYIFDDVPKNLRDQPTLSTLLKSSVDKMQNVELSYLSGGLSWKADYVAELNAEDDRLDLMAWVTLNNHSGTAYKNAKMQLVAGDVNQVKPAMDMVLAARMPASKNAVAEAEMQQESLFEYHLYTLGRPTSILDKQTKQVSLLTAPAVPAKKEYLLPGAAYYYSNRYGEIGKKMKVGVYLLFDNEKEHNLGVPLPKGVVRVYKRDKKGNAQFVGEDRIDHTPKKEEVRLKLGEAFDITADKKQTDYKILDHKNRHHEVEVAFEIKLKNAKPEAAVVVVREPIPGDWKMLKQSHKHTKVTSNMAEWRVEVPAEGSAMLTYRAKITF